MTGARVAIAAMLLLAVTLVLMETVGAPNALPIPRLCSSGRAALHVCPVMPERLPAHAANPSAAP